MIENVKDLSIEEKEKKLARKALFACFGKCLPAMILATFAVTLFGLYLMGDFMAAFTVEESIATTCKFVLAFALMFMLFAGVYKFAENANKNKRARDYWIAATMSSLAFICSVAGCVKLNTYVMLITFGTLVLIQIVGRRTAALSMGCISILLIFFVMLTNKPEAFDRIEIVKSTLCGCLGALIVSFFSVKHYSRLGFLIMALLAPLLLMPVVALVTVAGGDLTINILWNVLGSYGGNAVAALLFMPFVAIFEGAFNIADDFRLSELCNLNNPLLKRLASEAPGTFNHSLVVGNLAEACASAIGENPNMARCAAYFHDIGKLKAPIYFSENQSSYNPHDELIPEVSVSMITSHTLFGEILAKQNRLPSEIVDICRQHHGTSPVGYFYRKALSLREDGDLAVSKYTYSGPKPQTKIAAIIMIADTIEAAMRAYMPDTREEYEQRINKLVDEKIEMRQFDECPITLGDIAVIKRTIIEVLPSIHHSRVDYDKRKKFSRN